MCKSVRKSDRPGNCFKHSESSTNSSSSNYWRSQLVESESELLRGRDPQRIASASEPALLPGVVQYS